MQARMKLASRKVARRRRVFQDRSRIEVVGIVESGGEGAGGYTEYISYPRDGNDIHRVSRVRVWYRFVFRWQRQLTLSRVNKVR